MADSRNKPLTTRDLLHSVPQVWVILCIAIGLGAKLVYTTIWVKDTVVERADYQSEISALRKYIDMKSQEDRAYTDRALERFSEKVVAHADHNSDVMEVKWSRVSSTVEAIKEQSTTTQKLVIQLLMSKKR